MLRAQEKKARSTARLRDASCQENSLASLFASLEGSVAGKMGNTEDGNRAAAVPRRMSESGAAIISLLFLTQKENSRQRKS